MSSSYVQLNPVIYFLRHHKLENVFKYSTSLGYLFHGLKFKFSKPDYKLLLIINHVLLKYPSIVPRGSN